MSKYSFSETLRIAYMAAVILLIAVVATAIIMG